MRQFITCDLIGRLGNQLFQCFSTISTAKRFGIDWYIPRQTISPETWEFYFDECNLPVLAKNLEMEYLKCVYQESADHSYAEIPYIGKSFKINGFFQSEKYFIDARPEILEAFSCLFDGETYQDTVSIHIRRGDYLQYSDSFPPVTGEYLDKAIKYFTDKNLTNFMVFSDDINWCKNYFASYPESVTFDYSEGRTPIEDIKQMIKCSHNIISNSSFSWMGAWLNKNENKIVVSPSSDNWFGASTGLCTKDVIPESWVQIKF